MAESDGTRTLLHEMKAPAVLVALAAVVAPGASGQDRLPLSLRLVDARACGAPAARAGAVVTITPDGDGIRDCAALRFHLQRPSRVELVVFQRKPRPGLVHFERADRARRVDDRRVVTAADGRGADVPHAPHGEGGRLRLSFAGPVIRVRAVAARFERESYTPGAVARLRVDGGPGSLRLDIVDAATGIAVAGARIVRRGGRRRPRGELEPGGLCRDG